VHPVFLSIGHFSIRTYGVMVALAFYAALRLAQSAGKILGIEENFIMDLVALLAFSGIAGARLFYVLLNFPHYVQHPFEAFDIRQGGLVFYGGFIVAAIAGVLFTRRKKMSVARVADCLAPALAVGQALGRWGCFFAGCCYGKPTDLPWSVRFKDPLSLAPLGVDLHPVQIYESLTDLLIGLFLWLYLTKERHDDGQIFWFYILMYGAGRFAMELVRGDDRGPTLGGLYPSQIIALAAMIVASSVLVAQASIKEDAKEEAHES
jgi:phosphatidylglycerol:prolipoprotein diacylglycerol transferase